MKKVFFQQILEKKAFTKKWLTLPLSCILHSVLFFTLLVVPFLEAESQLPPIKVTYVVLEKPLLPSIPVSGGRRGPIRRMEKDKTKSTTSRTILVAPIKVPEHIEVDDLDYDLGEGLGNNIEGAPDRRDIDIIDVPRIDIPDVRQISNFTPVRVIKAKLIRQVNPVYPKGPLAARLEATVVIEAVTDVFGIVKRATIIDGHPLFNQAALNAVKQWVYEPYIVCGKPMPVIFSVTVKFKLTNI